MKRLFFILPFFIGLSLNAQQSISGTFSSEGESTMIIAYLLKPVIKSYIADTTIKNGEFILNLPASAEVGMYRFIYGLPEDELYFDAIYTGKEAIDISFDTENGITFNTSEENKIFNSYFKEMNSLHRGIISFYSEQKFNKQGYLDLLEKQRILQRSYEEKSRGLLVHKFITANKPYIPSAYEPIKDYLNKNKSTYFDNLDFTNSILQGSGFLMNKITDYVFETLLLNLKSQEESQIVLKANVKAIQKHLDGVSEDYKFHVFYKLWFKAAANNLNDLSDFIHVNYLVPSTVSTSNQKILDEVEIHNRLRIGAVAPEIVWNEGNNQKSLSQLSGAQNYVLIFWSSTCGHCLKQLPSLHESLKGNSNIKVIAVAFEDDDVNWKLESAKLENFEHCIALGYWDHDYANLYDIYTTPAYFILDANKRIINKPENDEGVVKFLWK